MEILAAFESGALSIWVRESPLVFPTLLIAHALGMGVIVGMNVFLAWRLYSGADRSEVHRSFEPIVWSGFGVSLISGLLLLAGYPAKALTNPVFYLKVLLLVTGLVWFRALRNPPVSISRTRLHAIALLLVWFATVTSGRLLAYTHDVLLASHFYP